MKEAKSTEIYTEDESRPSYSESEETKGLIQKQPHNIRRKEMAALKMLERPMSMNDIKEKAKNLGIDASKMKKAEIVHAVQRAEGFNACYGTTNGTCSQMECCWRWDCLKIRP